MASDAAQRFFVMRIEVDAKSKAPDSVQEDGFMCCGSQSEQNMG